MKKFVKFIFKLLLILIIAFVGIFFGKGYWGYLENLGFVPGTVIVVVSKTNGNVIVNVKEVRIAISEELARKIMV